MKRNKKKRSIFKMLLLPLIAVMLLQGMLTVGTLAVSRTLGTVQDYSVNMMSRTVANRRVILENEMTQRWASVSGQKYQVEAALEAFMAENGVTLEQMLASERLRYEFLETVYIECLDVLQDNLTSGIFMVYTGRDREEASRYEGFFLRDYDPMTRTVNYTDLLLERGNKKLSRISGVPLDTCWTTNFSLAGSGQRASDAFIYEPWRAGEEHPDADVKNLGYWSEPFVLENDPQDSHEMITYSFPLCHEGRVYGVMGVEIAVSYLYDYLPVSELSDGQQAGYLLALENGDGSYTPLLGRGVLSGGIVDGGSRFSMSGTGYGGFYQVDGVTLGSQKIYAVSCPLTLYDHNAPYEDTQWVLLGLNTDDTLFGMYRGLYVWLGIAILAGLAFGILGIYFCVRHLTMPIRNLMGCISGGGASLKNFQPSNILEIDGLHGVVEELTRRQKETENILLEEKERYRMALEGTNDTFFSYDMRKKTLDIVNNPNLNGLWDTEDAAFDMQMDKIYYEDRPLIEELLRNVPEKASVEFRCWIEKKSAYQWRGLYGNMVRDLEGEPLKLVGTIRNIQDQKESELARKERLERDSVTGLYTYTTGLERMNESRAAEPGGVMAYLYLEKLKEINETNGIVFGDMILEEVGRCLLEQCRSFAEKRGCRTIALRYDGDEFAIWLEKQSGRQAAGFARELTRAVEELFGGEVLRLRLRIGLAEASETEPSLLLLRKAKLAQEQVKENAAQNYLFFADIPAGNRGRLPALQARPLITNDYGDEVNLASLALNLFGRGADFPAQMALLLRKVGRHYGASDVLTTVIRADFYSNYLEYQWHRDTPPVREIVSQYTDEEWKVFEDWLGLAQVQSFTAEDSRLPVFQKFLHISEGQCGIVLPMYDSGVYMGNMCILGVDPSLLTNEEEKQNLAEFGNAIQSQMNQKKHDLASKAKSEFLSRMSHEIRTPMNGIIGMTAIALQENQDRDRMLDCLNKIQDSSRYLLGLINDILDMSKIESGKMHLELQNFDMREMIDTIKELVRPQMAAKKIEYIQDVDLTGRWFFADKLRISQVLVNLLGNASKFTPEGGKVTFTVRESAGADGRPQVYFAVRDTGIGIGEEDRQRVFRAFEQARSADAVSKSQGTGLGLSISSRLIQMMGSSINLESELGKGSCFSFTLALEPGQDTEESRDEEDFSFEGYRVLVVEDNELNSEIAQCLLENSGFKVDCVHDGSQAVERMRTTKPGTYDVILMDIMMPVMDGLEATRAIRAMDREDCRSIPIVAMSANAFDDDLKKSVECGMNGHISKPVEVDKLYKTLRSILESR